MATDKTLTVVSSQTAVEKIGDLKTWGDADTWKLIAKASSDKEGWMKSTKAMSVPGIGVVVQVTTQQGANIAEALTFVPFATIVDTYDVAGQLIGRRIAVENAPEDFLDG